MIVTNDDINPDDTKTVKCHFWEEIHSFPDSDEEFPFDVDTHLSIIFIPTIPESKVSNQHNENSADHAVSSSRFH